MLAKTVLAAATTVAVAVALAPSAFATAPRDPSCYITDNNASPGAYSYALEFYRTCGYSVRAWVHSNDWPYGTVTDVGNTVNGYNVTSSTMLQNLPRCSWGYQVYDLSGWDTIVLGGSGC